MQLNSKIRYGVIFVGVGAAMAVSIAAEMAFTLYTDDYGVANVIGHC